MFDAEATMKCASEEVLNIGVDQNIPLVNEEEETLEDTHMENEVLEETQDLPMNSNEHLFLLTLALNLF